MAKSKKITIEGTEITIISQKADDYISLTDMAKSQLQDVVIIKWLSLKNTAISDVSCTRRKVLSLID